MDDARSANHGQGVLAFRFSPRQCTFSSRAEIEDKRDREGNKPLKWRFPYTWEVSLSNNYYSSFVKTMPWKVPEP